MSNEQTQRSDSLVAKMQEALTLEQLEALSERQEQLFEARLGRLMNQYPDDQITPLMILGQYEIVTEHTMPSWMERGMSEAFTQQNKTSRELSPREAARASCLTLHISGLEPD